MAYIRIICFLVALVYGLLLLLYRRGWRRQAESAAASGFCPGTMISIIIPARNEAQAIGACIRSIQMQQYPPHLYEVIVVDDYSEDDTAAVVAAFDDPRIRCIRLADYLAPGEAVVSYKKKALAAGIAQGRGALIVTTDADCVAQADWLRNIAALYEQQQPVMIIAPVDFTSDGSAVQLFQSLDFMTMQGITVAAYRLRLGSMSNGANLAFSRAAFAQVGGYAGTEHLASGDDYLLTVKMQAAFPGRVACLKSRAAIVKTTPQPGWRSFLQQRIRWASKSGKYKDTRLTLCLLLVYLLNLSLAAVAVAAVFDRAALVLLMGMLAIKLCAELCFLWPVSGFFGKRRQLWWLLPFQPLHILYIVTAGFLGFAGVYRWKGRKIYGK